MKTNQNYPTMKDITKKVVITINQNHVTARIYDDNTIVAKGVSTCSPEDTFDFRTGAELALKRAFESIEIKEPTNNTKWVKVNRKPVPGDYIRVTYKGYPFDDFGEVLKVHKVDVGGGVHIMIEDHPKCKRWINKNFGGFWWYPTWAYINGEYEVVERVSKKTEKSIEPDKKAKWVKVDRNPRIGDYVRLTRDGGFSFDRKGDIMKVCEVGGSIVGVKAKDRPDNDGRCCMNGENYVWYYPFSKVEVVKSVKDNVEIWKGMRFRKVDREVRVGDYIKLKKPFFSFDSTDYFMKVSRVSYNNGRLAPHVNHIDNYGASKEYKDYEPTYEWNYWGFCGDVYEKVDE